MARRHNPNQGCFITVEGIEGAGKSTHMPLIGRILEESGYTVVLTREPGGTVLGEALRDLLLDATVPVAADAETLLMFAARAQHLEEVIRPALAQGHYVVCDRFTDATYAYQGYGRDVGTERVGGLEAWTQGGLRPDLTLLLDVPAELGLRRAAAATRRDRFEQESVTFFDRVRTGYQALAQREPDRIRVIPADGDVVAVESAINDTVRRWLRGP